MKNELRRILKLLYIFNKKVYEIEEPLIQQVITYNNSNLAMLLNSFAFIEMCNKEEEENKKNNIEHERPHRFNNFLMDLDK